MQCVTSSKDVAAALRVRTGRRCSPCTTAQLALEIFDGADALIDVVETGGDKLSGAVLAACMKSVPSAEDVAAALGIGTGRSRGACAAAQAAIEVLDRANTLVNVVEPGRRKAAGTVLAARGQGVASTGDVAATAGVGTWRRRCARTAGQSAVEVFDLASALANIGERCGDKTPVPGFATGVQGGAAHEDVPATLRIRTRRRRSSFAAVQLAIQILNLAHALAKIGELRVLKSTVAGLASRLQRRSGNPNVLTALLIGPTGNLGLRFHGGDEYENKQHCDGFRTE